CLSTYVLTLELALLRGSARYHGRISVHAHLKVIIVELIVLEVTGLDGVEDFCLRKELARDVDNGVVSRRHSVKRGSIALYDGLCPVHFQLLQLLLNVRIPGLLILLRCGLTGREIKGRNS